MQGTERIVMRYVLHAVQPLLCEWIMRYRRYVRACTYVRYVRAWLHAYVRACVRICMRLEAMRACGTCLRTCTWGMWAGR
jgi:hypothetical protein